MRPGLHFLSEHTTGTWIQFFVLHSLTIIKIFIWQKAPVQGGGLSSNDHPYPYHRHHIHWGTSLPPLPPHTLTHTHRHSSTHTEANTHIHSPPPHATISATITPPSPFLCPPPPAGSRRTTQRSVKITVIGWREYSVTTVCSSLLLSLLSKAFRLLYGQVEFLHQLVVGAVGGQVEAVEAGVTAGQPCFLAYLLYAEPLRTVAPCTQTGGLLISWSTCHFFFSPVLISWSTCHFFFSPVLISWSTCHFFFSPVLISWSTCHFFFSPVLISWFTCKSSFSSAHQVVHLKLLFHLSDSLVQFTTPLFTC